MREVEGLEEPLYVVVVDVQVGAHPYDRAEHLDMHVLRRQSRCRAGGLSRREADAEHVGPAGTAAQGLETARRRRLPLDPVRDRLQGRGDSLDAPIEKLPERRDGHGDQDEVAALADAKRRAPVRYPASVPPVSSKSSAPARLAQFSSSG